MRLRTFIFSKIADSWGMFGKKILKTKDFAEAFKEATKSEKGGILDLKINIEAISPYKTLSSL